MVTKQSTKSFALACIFDAFFEQHAGESTGLDSDTVSNYISIRNQDLMVSLPCEESHTANQQVRTGVSSSLTDTFAIEL